MSKISDYKLTQPELIALLTKVAESERQSDGFSDIRTPNMVANGIDYYVAALQGEVPKSLEKYLVQAQRERDPEWAELVRLQNKFGIKS